MRRPKLQMIRRWIEITFTAILVYLVLTNAPGFSEIVRQIGRSYVDIVRALQGQID